MVCTNILTFFYLNGRGDELSETLNWVFDMLKHRAYLDGTYYYAGADTFLFFLSRFLRVAKSSPSTSVFNRFAPIFSERVHERMGASGDALALSMRILAASVVEVCDRVDYEALLDMQEGDGGFPAGWMYKYGMSGMLLGNRGFTTALAVKAVKEIEKFHHT